MASCVSVCVLQVCSSTPFTVGDTVKRSIVCSPITTSSKKNSGRQLGTIGFRMSFPYCGKRGEDVRKEINKLGKRVLV